MKPTDRRQQALDVIKGCRPHRPHKHESLKHEFIPHRHDGSHVKGEAWSQCAKKRSYSSRRMAERVAERIRAERGVELRVYQCDFCNGYHLSKQFRHEGDLDGNNAGQFDTMPHSEWQRMSDRLH